MGWEHTAGAFTAWLCHTVDVRIRQGWRNRSGIVSPVWLTPVWILFQPRPRLRHCKETPGPEFPQVHAVCLCGSARPDNIAAYTEGRTMRVKCGDQGPKNPCPAVEQGREGMRERPQLQHHRVCQWNRQSLKRRGGGGQESQGPTGCLGAAGVFGVGRWGGVVLWVRAPCALAKSFWKRALAQQALQHLKYLRTSDRDCKPLQED